MLDNKPKEHNKTMHNENPNPLARHRVFTGLVILAVATTIVGTNAGNAGKAVTTSNAASSQPSYSQFGSSWAGCVPGYERFQHCQLC